MKILNTEKEDYHVHSMNYSDGLSTIDEIARFAGEIGMKKIVICDHSQALIDKDQLAKKTFRSIALRWKNVFNDVDISFGVEADVLNEKGDICSNIGGEEGSFLILSYHDYLFKGNKKKAADAFIKAIERYHDKINIIGHVVLGLTEQEAERVIKVANKYKIPCELNCKYFFKYPDAWGVLFRTADKVYVNSDAHTLYEIKELRKQAWNRLKEMRIVATLL